MKCMLIGIALSACVSVWTGTAPTRLTADGTTSASAAVAGTAR